MGVSTCICECTIVIVYKFWCYLKQVVISLKLKCIYLINNISIIHDQGIALFHYDNIIIVNSQLASDYNKITLNVIIFSFTKFVIHGHVHYVWSS